MKPTTRLELHNVDNIESSASAPNSLHPNFVSSDCLPEAWWIFSAALLVEERVGVRKGAKSVG